MFSLAGEGESFETQDRDIVLMAVQKKGDALEFAPKGAEFKVLVCRVLGFRVWGVGFGGGFEGPKP